MPKLSHNLDDLEALVSMNRNIPDDVREFCLDAYRSGKQAEDIGDWVDVERMIDFIRNNLLLRQILE